MSVIDFFRSRKAAPSATSQTPMAAAFGCRACSPEDFGRCICPQPCGWLECMGNRNAAHAAPAATDYATRIDVQAKAAEIVAQAQCRPPWDTAPQPGRPDLLADEAHRLYGWDITALDVPPAHDRPYIPGVLGAGGRLTPRTAGVADDLAALVLFRASVERMVRPCCEDCQQQMGTWQERLYGTYRHHTWPVTEAAPREFGIATELRQAHGETAADADDAEAAFARRYLMRRAA